MRSNAQAEFFFIDTSQRGIVRLARLPMDAHKKIVTRTWEGRQQVVRCAETFFGAHLAHACGMMVVAGPGSFSAIRSGVLVANVFSRLRHLPLYQFTVNEADDLFVIRERALNGQLKPVSYVAPIYDAEPNITVKTAMTPSP